MSDRPPPRNEGERSAIAAGVAGLPFHVHCGLEILECADGRSRARFRTDPPVLNNTGILHGGILYALLDTAAYLAVASRLPADRNAVTNDLSVSLLRAVPADRVVELEGTCLKAGRRLAFAEARALVEGTLVGRAQVTKSVVAWSP